jgi:hypothetical protein
MPRPDTRSINARRYPFEVVKAAVKSDRETPYDARIDELRTKNHKITTDDGFAAWMEDKRDEHLADKDTAELNAQYRAAMHSDPTVVKLLRLREFLEADESVDQKLIQQVSNTIEQWTEPGASRTAAEQMANELFAAENDRRGAIEAELQAESAKWNQKVAELRKRQFALQDAPDASVSTTEAPATLEGNMTFKSDTLVGKSYELWGLVDNEVRDKIDLALHIHKHGDSTKLEAIVSKYAKPVASESEAIQANAERIVKADAERGGFDG